MFSPLLRSAVVLAALAAWVLPLRAQRWNVQYFYDKPKSTLVLADLQFASALRGVAVGSIVEGGKMKPTAVVTADGGAHWELLPLKEVPLSLFLLNENIGWLVTNKGLWETQEAGKSWRKLPGLPKPVTRVYFTDETHGWAVGPKKAVLQTEDGGRHWKAVEAASKTPGAPEYSAYSWIAFPTPKEGIIIGWNRPPQRRARRVPDWMDPEAVIAHRETPHLSLSLETHDGGKEWRASSSSTFGSITRIRFQDKIRGLGLVEYSESFQYPSEVYEIMVTAGGGSRSVYRNKRLSVTDIWLGADGTAYIGGALRPGQMRVVPGRVQVLKSNDLKVWSPMEVDYRAVADGAVFAGAGGQMWLATDAGMILKLEP